MFIFRVITKKGNQIIPRCSKRQKGLDATPIEGISTIRGKKITQHTNAQGNLRKMVREEASRKRQRPSPAQVRITEEETGYVQDEEPRYVHDDDPDAWRYVEDPEDELEKEDKENTEEAEAEKENENSEKEEAYPVGSEPEVEKEQEKCLTDQSKNKKRRTRGPTKMNKVAKRHEEKVEVQFNTFGERVCTSTCRRLEAPWWPDKRYNVGGGAYLIW